ncbi:MAG: aminotransferase class IV family protein [Anaerolineae bacterium]|nr:aminotransferase class IV family protein [Anaerolineae bacterium]
MNLPLFVSCNGELSPVGEAHVPIRHPALLAAFGVYETVQVSQDVPFHLAEHLNRMAFSARQIELELPAEPETIGTWVPPLLAANGAPECLLKFLVYGPGEGYPPLCFLWPEAMPRYPEHYYTGGADAITVAAERTLPTAKTLCTLVNFLARRQARRAGVHEALLLNNAGRVTEGSNSNFFVVREGVLLTAPAASVLSGVTRDLTLRLARQAGIQTGEQELPLAERGTWEEAFITSTSRHIMPLAVLDGKPIGTGRVGPLTRRLMDAFVAHFREEVSP